MLMASAEDTICSGLGQPVFLQVQMPEGAAVLKVNQIKLPLNHSKKQLKEAIVHKLRIRPEEMIDYRILKQSIDARKSGKGGHAGEVLYQYSVAVTLANEKQYLKKHHANKDILPYTPVIYQMPEKAADKPAKPPVIIGSGPAGLFCGLMLARQGYDPIILERGSEVHTRMEKVNAFWAGGKLDKECNVQFGEGGAGTFSDGKLNTSVKDPSGRNRLVLETFVRFGADPSILYDNKPHIGTDVLSEVIVNMREFLVDKGATFVFDTCVNNLDIVSQKLLSVYTDSDSNSNSEIKTDVCVLALGHSARDTFDMLYNKGFDMECKSFAVGFRVEHPQRMIDESQYGIQKKIILPPSPYKVTSNFPNGRGVYSFCMCPGGYVVNSSSTEKHTVVNGMSYHDRNSKNANSAIIVSVSPKDFGADDALAGVRYQEKLETENYKRGNGLIPQQLFGDFCDDRLTTAYGDFGSCTKGNTVFAKLNGLMNADMEQSFKLGMEHFGHLIHGFDRKDAILSGMETRTSSPLRIKRDESFESNISGVYPCGEGAGYAGGITSAAIDGIKVAEAIIKKYRPDFK